MNYTVEVTQRRCTFYIFCGKKVVLILNCLNNYVKWVFSPFILNRKIEGIGGTPQRFLIFLEQIMISLKKIINPFSKKETNTKIVYKILVPIQGSQNELYTFCGTTIFENLQKTKFFRRAPVKVTYKRLFLLGKLRVWRNP